MNKIMLETNQFTQSGYWQTPLTNVTPSPLDLNLFDQNGYDLTLLEQYYSAVNNVTILNHRSHKVAIKQPWFTQATTIEGCVLNHSLLFERKAYHGSALEQLQSWSKELPLLHKLISMRPKWGLDFSMDYVDRHGNAFEVLHWEYDGFDYDEIQSIKLHIEPKLLSIDWEHAAQQLLVYKDHWHHLDFFEQSDWKCNYFGIAKERFKMVCWS